MGHINYYTRCIRINYNSSIQIRTHGHPISRAPPRPLPLLTISLHHCLDQAFCHLAYTAFFHVNIVSFPISKQSEKFEIRDYLIVFVTEPFPEKFIQRRHTVNLCWLKYFKSQNLLMHCNMYNKIHYNTGVTTWWVWSCHITCYDKNLIYVVIYCGTKSPKFDGQLFSVSHDAVKQFFFLLFPFKHI